MTVIDSHVHVNHGGFRAADIIRYLDRERIDACFLLTWEEIEPGPWTYRHLPVEEVYDMYLKYPTRVIPFYAPDPHRSDASMQMEYWHQKGVRGCGELKATVRWDSDSAKAIIETARHLRAPIVFHMENASRRLACRTQGKIDQFIRSGLLTTKKKWLVPHNILKVLYRILPPVRSRVFAYDFPGYMMDIAALRQTLKDFPDVSFIAHGPGFWKHMSEDGPISKDDLPRGPVIGKGIIWELLERYPNLYADTSADSGLNALARDPQNAKEFLSHFEDKILYGTDNVMKGQRAFLDSLLLSRRTYRKVYGENACRLVSSSATCSSSGGNDDGRTTGGT